VYKNIDEELLVMKEEMRDGVELDAKRESDDEENN